MADGVDVFDRAVRKKDSDFLFVIPPFIYGSIDCPLPLGSILRMNALQPLFPSWNAVFWIKAIYAIPFLGQMQRLSSPYAPNPTPHMREPLRFRQITLAPPQRFFRLLCCGDVHHRSNKLDAARYIVQGMRHNVDIFDGAVRHQQSKFKIKILPILRRALDCLFHAGRVFRMSSLENKFHGRAPNPFRIGGNTSAAAGSAGISITFFASHLSPSLNQSQIELDKSFNETTTPANPYAFVGSCAGRSSRTIWYRQGSFARKAFISLRTSTLHTLLFLVTCPVILIFAGPLTKTGSPQAGPLVVGTVTSGLALTAGR